MELPIHVVAIGGDLRCRNCDSSVDETGKWIDDNDYYGEDPDYCPDCAAKMKQVR